MSENNDFLSAVRASLREEQRFFSNAAKPERELWVAREFLRALGVEFDEAELVTTPQYSDADVLFRDASFQIKEIPAPELRRNSEIRSRLARAEAALRPEDLISPVQARDIVFSSAYKLIFDLASAAKYARTKSKLDLLCYVTHPYALLGSQEEQRSLASVGWRSISCLFGSRALVLATAADAPALLRRRGSAANNSLQRTPYVGSLV